MTLNEAPPTRRLQVLVLDDALDVRERIVSLISELSDFHEAAVAGSVSEARELLRTLRPDVALLDLRLPDGSGLEVLRAIRSQNAGAFVAILTAFDTAQMRQSCLAAGADAFLSKTSGIMELSSLLSSVAAREVQS